MMMEFTEMECGFTGNVFKQSYKQYAVAIIGENWITGIWAHLERCEAKAKITGLWKPTYRRDNDNAIMETITASARFRPVEIREIKRCRLYLQVFYTSDIADISGKNLEPWVMKGQGQSTRKSIWEWLVVLRARASARSLSCITLQCAVPSRSLYHIMSLATRYVGLTVCGFTLDNKVDHNLELQN
jgi:hypothetical protein